MNADVVGFFKKIYFKGEEVASETRFHGSIVLSSYWSRLHDSIQKLLTPSILHIILPEKPKNSPFVYRAHEFSSNNAANMNQHE